MSACRGHCLHLKNYRRVCCALSLCHDEHEIMWMWFWGMNDTLHPDEHTPLTQLECPTHTWTTAGDNLVQKSFRHLFLQELQCSLHHNWTPENGSESSDESWCFFNITKMTKIESIVQNAHNKCTIVCVLPCTVWPKTSPKCFAYAKENKTEAYHFERKLLLCKEL